MGNGENKVLEEIRDAVKEYYHVLQDIQKTNEKVIQDMKECKAIAKENKALREENEALKKEIKELKEQLEKEQQEDEREM